MQSIRASVGRLKAVDAERLELQNRLEPKEHDWWYVRGQWKEVVVSDGKYEEIGW